MKAAITVHCNCVSPVFDWAREIAIAEFAPSPNDEVGELSSKEVFSLKNVARGQRANFIESLDVEVLLCGGISGELLSMLNNKNIRVISGIMGNIESVIEAFRTNCISSPEFAMPGWKGCCHAHGNRRRHRHRDRCAKAGSIKYMNLSDNFNIQLAVASGKGGTGKTTVATNLAMISTEVGYKTQILDCDVEAPNAHLFLKPTTERSTAVKVSVPVIDETLCSACGECGRICQFSAVVSLKTKPLLFPELCHGCGGCMLICPEHAITEGEREVGLLNISKSGALNFIDGKMSIGEAMSPPVIKAVKMNAATDGVVIIDAPPGSSCPAIEAIRDADFVLLVTEPTPFGVNDLDIAVKTVRKLGLPFGVVINRCILGQDLAHAYCKSNNIDILAEIPDDASVREAYSNGELAISASPEMRKLYLRLLEDIKTLTSELVK